MKIRVGIMTVSDRASRGEYEDLGGPALKEESLKMGWEVACEELVPDDRTAIQRGIRKQIAQGCHLILTTGGTGISPRDVTPEAVLELADRQLPGFGEAMRMRSLEITPNAILSRGLAASIGSVMVICLPGKPQGAIDCLRFVAGAIPHGVKVLQEVPTSC